MSDAHLDNDAQTTDAELLSRLRDGDANAYIELWRRHVKAALRVAHHVAPGQAEDLVAESFTAVFNQITRMGALRTSGGGHGVSPPAARSMRSR